MRIRRGDQRETDARHASRGKAEPASRRAREIDDPTLHMRAAVVDSDLHGTRGLEIGDEHTAAEGKGLVGRRHLMLVKRLAARRRLAVMGSAVPGRIAALHESVSL
jgi:hypothetical protein